MRSECTDLKRHTYDLLLSLIKTAGVTHLQEEWLDKFRQDLIHKRIDKTNSSTGTLKIYTL